MLRCLAFKIIGETTMSSCAKIESQAAQAASPESCHQPATVSAGRTRRVLVITCHGIRTIGSWQSNLESILRQQHAEHTHTRQDYDLLTLEVVHKNYGYFSIFSFLNIFQRNAATRSFAEELEKLVSAGT
jgi:hypothetical protein